MRKSSTLSCFAAMAVLTVALPAVGGQTYVAPPSGTKSLIREISAVRNADGTITVTGIVLLPHRTKVWVERVSPSGKTLAQAQTVVGSDGSLCAGPFSDDGRAPKSGPQRIRVFSMFNKARQSPEILAITGEGGTKLPASSLQPDDREFPNAGRHVEETRLIQFPAVSEETAAIERVKNSKLYVQGQGQAVDTVGFIVGEFAKAPGFKPLSWSAKKTDKKWVVTLDCQDGSARKQAQWEYDPAMKKVRYLDPLSKVLSWMPAE